MILALCISVFAAATAGVDANVVRRELAEPVLSTGSKGSSFTAVFEEVAAADRAADAAWRRVSSRAEYDERRRAMWQKMVEAIGGLPEKTPLNAIVMETVLSGGCLVDKVIFESLPGVYVTGHFFRPSDEDGGPRPAVVVACGHSSNGKNFWGYQRACVQLVQHGLCAFIYDPYEQGDRIQIAGSKSCTHGHNLAGVRAMLLGDSMAKYRIWDGIRAIDYVLTRDDVKKDEIGFEGQSGGGTMTALMMAVDDRIRVAAPSCYLTNMRELAMHCGPQDAEQNIFGQLAIGLNHAGYVLMQDIPVMMVCRKNDFFPYYGTCETFDVVRELASRIDTSGKYRIFAQPGPHGWIDATREASACWMEQWLLGGQKAPEPAALQFLDVGADIKNTRDCGLPEDRAPVPPTGQVRDMPDFRSILDVLRGRLASFERVRRPLSPGARAELAKDRAKVKLAQEAGVRVQMVADTNLTGCVVRRIAFGYPNQLVVPAVMFIPSDRLGAPALVAVNGGRTNAAEKVAALLAAGRPVLVPDFTASGEIGAAKHVFYGAGDAPEEEVAMMLYWLGDSLVGRRATDLLVAANYLSATCGVVPELVADGAAVIPAAHAYAADPSAFAGVTTSNPPPSWADVVRRDSPAVRFFNCVNGALKDYDWPELLP